MNELRRAAMTYYNAFPAGVRVTVDQFFATMDANNDGKISYSEFSNFLADEGHHKYNNPSFFDEIRTERTNSLNKADVITLYYILKSRRPVCDLCRRLISGLYFTCETCFKRNGPSCNLHSHCLGEKVFRHRHSKWVDNFTLLTLRRSKHFPAENTSQVVSFAQASPSHYRPQTVRVDSMNPYQASASSSSLAIVPAQPNPNRHRKRKAAYQALEKIITVASIASNCTIM